MLDTPVEPGVAVAPPLNKTSEAMTPTAKNLEGYTRVIVLEADRAPPALGVKLNVTGTPGFFTTRSLFAISNATLATEPPRKPDQISADGIKSVLVVMLTKPPAVGVFPMVKPCNVIVTAALEEITPDFNVTNTGNGNDAESDASGLFAQRQN